MLGRGLSADVGLFSESFNAALSLGMSEEWWQTHRSVVMRPQHDVVLSQKILRSLRDVKDMKRTDVAPRYEPICEPIADHMSNRSIESEGVTISCYKNELLSFVEAEIKLN